MKLRGKKQNLTKEVMKQNNPDYSILTKNKKTSNISVNKEFSNLESNQTSHENSKIDIEKESRYKPKLRNIDMNYPGKYKKMNSGKYLYKMKKPEKRAIVPKKVKKLLNHEKTFKNFDFTTVKVMTNFFNKLCDLEFDKINSFKKKKTKKIDQMTMKLLSDDTLTSNMNSKINFSEHSHNNNYGNNNTSIFHYNKSNSEIPVSSHCSNIHYKFIYPNNIRTNDFNKPNQPQNMSKKIFEQNMLSRIDSNTNEKSIAEISSKMICHNNLDKRNSSYNDYAHQPIKDIIKKNTNNHIVAANFIKVSQEEFLKNPGSNTSNINNNIYNIREENYNKPNELTAIKQSYIYKETLTSKNSTESEKSEEKLNYHQLNNKDATQNNVKRKSNNSFHYNVEDLTKNQLDQINEIVKGKMEKETTLLLSRKNSEFL